MDIIQALQSDDVFGVRVTNEDKWLVYNDSQWVVYQKKPYAKNVKVLYIGSDEEQAVFFLLRG